jgi:hypothetical protein
VTLDPALRERVLSGSIQKHACPTCKQTFTIDTDLLYHDMKRKFMISYQSAPGGHTQPVDTRFLEGIGAMMSQYQLRFVITWNQLTEKIRIFEAGLDDAQIELMKLFVAQKAFGHVDFPDDTIYFAGKRQPLFGAGSLRFEIYQNGGLWATSEFPLAEYKKVADDAQKELGENYGAGEWKTVNQASIRPST